MAKTKADKYGNVFASGPVAQNDNSLGGSRSGVVAKVKKRPKQPQDSQNFSQAEDINALFQGLRGQGTPQGVRKPIVRRGMSGQELDANGQDPGRGMSWFDRNNSEAQVQGRIDRTNREHAQNWAQRDAAGAVAVQERRALQGMGGAPYQQTNPNLVKGNDGYMDLFNGQGKILGSTRPQGQVSGFGDPTNTSLESQRAGAGMQDMFQKNFRAGNSQGAMAPNTGPQFLLQPRGDFLTPGGGGGPTVGGSSSQGAPGGGIFGPPRPPKPNYSSVDPFSLSSSYPPFGGMGPNSGPPDLRVQGPVQPMGPQPFQPNPDQAAALARLKAEPSNLNYRISDYYPGSDWEYLQQLFPFIDSTQFRTTNDLLDAYRSLY